MFCSGYGCKQRPLADKIDETYLETIFSEMLLEVFEISTSCRAEQHSDRNKSPFAEGTEVTSSALA